MIIDTIRLVHYEKKLFSGREKSFIDGCGKISGIASEESLDLLLSVFNEKVSFSYTERNAMTDALAKIGVINPEKIRQFVIKGKTVNYIALSAYSKICPVDEYTYFREMFAQTGDPAFILHAANINSDENRMWLKDIADDPSAEFRKEALDSLISLRSGKYDHDLMKYLDDTDQSLRFSAAAYFNLFNSEKDFSDEVKLRIQFGLKNWNDVSGKFSPELSSHVLKKHLHDSDAAIVLKLLEIIGMSEDSEIEKFYYEAVNSHNAEIRKAAVKYGFRYQSLHADIIGHLADSDKSVRDLITGILITEFNSEILKEMTDVLGGLKEDKSTVMLINSIQYVLVQRGNDFSSELSRIITSAGKQLAIRLMPVITEIYSPDFKDAVSALLKSSDAEIRENAEEMSSEIKVLYGL